MKTVVVYYTRFAEDRVPGRFGHNRVIAEAVAAETGASRARIETVREHGYALMGFHSFFNLDMGLKPMQTDFSEYDLLILCTPVWAWKPASPARTFLKRAKLPPRLAVCFSTAGGPTLRAQEKIRQTPRHAVLRELLAGRAVEPVAFGEIDTRAEDEAQLRRAGREFGRRVSAGSPG